MTKYILLAAFLAATQAHAASEPCYCENPVASPKGGIKGTDGTLDGTKMPAPVGDGTRGVIVTSGGSSDI